MKVIVKDIGDGFFECVVGGQVTYTVNGSSWNSYAKKGMIYEEAQLAHWADNGTILELEDGTLPNLPSSVIFGKATT